MQTMDGWKKRNECIESEKADNARNQTDSKKADNLKERKNGKKGK